LDRHNINRIIQQDPEYLMKLGIWGRKSGELKQMQIGIVLTVASYAAAGWEKIPSHKQAKHVIAALDIAENAGFNIGQI